MIISNKISIHFENCMKNRLYKDCLYKPNYLLKMSADIELSNYQTVNLQGCRSIATHPRVQVKNWSYLTLWCLLRLPEILNFVKIGDGYGRCGFRRGCTGAPPPPINERERQIKKGEGRKYVFFLLSFFAVSPHTECCPGPAGDLDGPHTPSQYSTPPLSQIPESMPGLRYQRYITLTYIPGAKIHIFAVLHKLRYNNGQDVKQFSINQTKRDNACIRLIRLRNFFNFRSYYSFVHTLHR